MKEQSLDIVGLLSAIRESGPDSKIYIGADSQAFRDKKTKKDYYVMVTGVIIHFDGCRGGKMFKEIIVKPDPNRSMRARLLDEVSHICQVGMKIVDHIGDRTLEIHLDVNPDEKEGSNVVFREAVGWLTGVFGFQPVVKPEAFASSTLADKYTKKAADRGKKGYERIKSKTAA